MVRIEQVSDRSRYETESQEQENGWEPELPGQPLGGDPQDDDQGPRMMSSCIGPHSYQPKVTELVHCASRSSVERRRTLRGPARSPHGSGSYFSLIPASVKLQL